jgi:hypothetical protein
LKPKTLLKGGVPSKPLIFANNDLMDEQDKAPVYQPAPKLRQPRTLLVNRIQGSGRGAFPVAGNLWIFANNDLMDEQPPAPVYQDEPLLRPWIFAKSPPAVLLQYYVLSAGYGAFALTGQSTTIEADRLLTASQGAFTLSGKSVTAAAARVVTAGYGAFALTGNSATVAAARILTAGYGAFVLNGKSVTAAAARLLTASYGAFTLSGQSAGMLQYVAPVGTASALRPWIFVPFQARSPSTGTSYTLVAQTGYYTLTGKDGTTFAYITMAASYGSFALSGQNVVAVAARVVSAGVGSYTLNGQSVTLLYSSSAVSTSWKRRRRSMLASRGRGI